MLFRSNLFLPRQCGKSRPNLKQFRVWQGAVRLHELDIASLFPFSSWGLSRLSCPWQDMPSLFLSLMSYHVEVHALILDLLMRSMRKAIQNPFELSFFLWRSVRIEIFEILFLPVLCHHL